MPNIKTFRMQKQAAPNWCWAAVAVSVDHFFAPKSHKRQCGLVTEVFREWQGEGAPKVPLHGCCAKPVPGCCNKAWYLEDALKKVDRLNGDPTKGTLSFQKIQRQIKADRPVCLRIQWRKGGGHFVVISECYTDRNGVRQVTVQDPWTGLGSEVSYYAIVHNFGRAGFWSHTYPV
jgi:hypothetical protein